MYDLSCSEHVNETSFSTENGNYLENLVLNKKRSIKVEELTI
jgi:hypothetical protein